jgi:FeS assembly SUF system protein
MTSTDLVELRSRTIAALRQIRDPEIPLNIYDLGLIYNLDVTPEGAVNVRMTLTSPNCPVAEALPGHVEEALGGLDGVRDVDVELVWDPPWSRDRMSEAARLELGLEGGPVPVHPFVAADSLAKRKR